MGHSLPWTKLIKFATPKLIYLCFTVSLYKVTALEGINNIGSEQLLDSILSEHLRCFCGVVAVGTLHGHVYLLGLYSFYVIWGN